MSPSLQAVIGAEALAAFETPGPVARGLTSTAYTSEAFFALENERLFPGSWVFAGFAHELARPGDAMPVSVAGRPLLLVRDAGGRIRAFHNVCRHRCLKLVDAPCNVGRAIRCPYHSWTYGLDGSLRLTPLLRRPGSARGAAGLRPCGARAGAGEVGDVARLDLRQPRRRRTAVRGLHGAARTPARRVRPRRPPPSRHHRLRGSGRELEAPDGELHRALPRAVRARHHHRAAPWPTTTRSTTRLPRMRHRRLGRRDAGRHPVGERPLPHPVPELRVRVLRSGPGRRTDRPAAGPGPHHPAPRHLFRGPEPASAGQTERLVRLWREVHREDHAMCERLQQGRASEVAAGGGVLSPVWEDSVRTFQGLVVGSLR